MDHSTAEYHLRRLVKARLVVTMRQGRVVSVWVPGRGFCPLQRAVLPRVAPLARDLFAALAADASSPDGVRLVDVARRALGHARVDYEVRCAAAQLLALGLVARAGHGRLRAPEEMRACAEPIREARACPRALECPTAHAWRARGP